VWKNIPPTEKEACGEFQKNQSDEVVTLKSHQKTAQLLGIGLSI
jgi:hypothetical protein